MTLFEALRILAETHTRDADVTGFVIMVGVSPASPAAPYPPERYNEAWNVVRGQLRMQMFPDVCRDEANDRIAELEAALRAIIDFNDGPIERKRPDVYMLLLQRARVVLTTQDQPDKS